LPAAKRHGFFVIVARGAPVDARQRTRSTSRFRGGESQRIREVRRQRPAGMLASKYLSAFPISCPEMTGQRAWGLGLGGSLSIAPTPARGFHRISRFGQPSVVGTTVVRQGAGWHDSKPVAYATRPGLWWLNDIQFRDSSCWSHLPTDRQGPAEMA
jgi:hypothetical protein